MSLPEHLAAASGQAEHLLRCPHVQSIVLPVPANAPTKQTSCSECDNKVENWICLTCYKSFCGRFAQKHMVQHFEAENKANPDKHQHCIALGTADLSCWCYKCDSYINHLTIRQVFAVYDEYHQRCFGTPSIQRPTEQQFLVGDGKSPAAAQTQAPAAAPANSVQSAQKPMFYSVRQVGEAKAGAHLVSVAGLADSALNDPLIDKILGAIYGNALGDAFGLSTEFLDSDQVKQLYPESKIPFPDFKRNYHNSRWDKGDWTDDTDQCILILQTINEVKKADPVVFAGKLYQWIRKGFPELGDHGGMGLGATVGEVSLNSKFLTDPHAAAQYVWNRTGQKIAPNGAVMRTSILGVYEYDNLQKVIANTTNIAKVTHFDPRCVASSVLVTTAIAMILQGIAHDTPAERENILAEALKQCAPIIGNDEKAKAEWMKHINFKTVQDLKLDESHAIGYTLKAVGCGVYALRADLQPTANTTLADGFIRVLHEIVLEAGDADTNGAVAGAILGCRIGYRALPQDWLEALPNKRWLDIQIVRFLSSIMKLVALRQ